MGTGVAVSGVFLVCVFESLEFARFRRPLASLSPLWYVAHTSEAISLASEATSLAHVTCTCGGMLCICICARDGVCVCASLSFSPSVDVSLCVCV